MKKRTTAAKKILLTTLIAAMLLGALAGCNGEWGTGGVPTGPADLHSTEPATTQAPTEQVPTGTGASQISPMLSNPYRTDPNRVANQFYYGTFNGYHVYETGNAIGDLYWSQTAAGYTFYSLYGELKCYPEDTTAGADPLTLEQAYEEGILTEAEVAYLATYLQELMLFEHLVGIDATEEYYIKKAFLSYDSARLEAGQSPAPEDLTVRCLQKRDGVYAAIVDGVEYQNEETVINWWVEKYAFQFPTAKTVLIYKDGVCYDVLNAFEKGIVDDIYLLDLFRFGYRDYVWFTAGMYIPFR